MDDHTVVGRVLDVLVAASSRASIGLTEIAAMTAIPKPTVRRIAEDLVRRGALEHTDLGYRIGPMTRQFARSAPLPELTAVTALLEALRQRFGGVAWYLERDDRLEAQPTLALSSPTMRRRVATAWPDPRSPTTYAQTACGHAVLACRPDLLERLIYAERKTGAAHVPGGIAEAVRRGAGRGAFFDDGNGDSGWRCVAIRIPAASAAAGGIVGIAVPDARASIRDLIAETRLMSQTLTSAR